MKSANNAALYCAMYPEFAAFFRMHGYALAIHGSLQRDFDLVAIPWVQYPTCPYETVRMFAERHCLKMMNDDPVMKFYNRACWTLSISWGECFIDLSVILPDTPLASEGGVSE